MKKITLTDIVKVFGANVRLVRKSQKITQAQLANRVGCHTNAISNIEKGKADPSLTNAIKISLALQIPIAKLIDPDFSKRF
jgi:transcriptional regulator with XRE-family HTH domain